MATLSSHARSRALARSGPPHWHRAPYALACLVGLLLLSGPLLARADHDHHNGRDDDDDDRRKSSPSPSSATPSSASSTAAASAATSGASFAATDAAHGADFYSASGIASYNGYLDAFITGNKARGLAIVTTVKSSSTGAAGGARRRLAWTTHQTAVGGMTALQAQTLNAALLNGTMATVMAAQLGTSLSFSAITVSSAPSSAAHTDSEESDHAWSTLYEPLIIGLSVGVSGLVVVAVAVTVWCHCCRAKSPREHETSTAEGADPAEVGSGYAPPQPGAELQLCAKAAAGLNDGCASGSSDNAGMKPATCTLPVYVYLPTVTPAEGVPVEAGPGGEPVVHVAEGVPAALLGVPVGVPVGAEDVGSGDAPPGATESSADVVDVHLELGLPQCPEAAAGTVVAAPSEAVVHEAATAAAEGPELEAAPSITRMNGRAESQLQGNI